MEATSENVISKRGDRGLRGRGGGGGGRGFRGRGRGGEGGFRGRGRGGEGGFRGRGRGGEGGFRGRGRGGENGFRGRGRGGEGGFRGRGRGGENGFRGRGRGGEGGFRGRGRGGENGFRGRGRGGEGGFRGRGRGGEGGFRGRGRGGEGGFRGRGRGQAGDGPQGRGNVRFADVVKKTQLAPEDTRKSILITNVPKGVEKNHDKFQQFISEQVGPVKSLFYQKITCKNCCAMSATCVFKKPSDYYVALKKLHGQQFLNRPLLVQKFLNGNSNENLITEHCIRVTNLQTTTTENDLWNLFEGCGKLGMVYIDRRDVSSSTLEALVNFQNSDSLVNSLKLDGSMLRKSQIKVVHLDWKLSINIYNFKKTATLQDFETLLSDYNPFFVRMSYKKKKGNSVFASFSDEKSYSDALTLNKKDFDGYQIVVEPALTYNVYMLIPSDISKDQVFKALKPFGAPRGYINASKRFNIKKISLESEEEVTAALQASTVLIKGKFIEIWDLDSMIEYEQHHCDDAELGGEEEEMKDEACEWDNKNEIIKEEVEGVEDEDEESEDEESEDEGSEDEEETEIKTEEVEDEEDELDHVKGRPFSWLDNEDDTSDDSEESDIDECLVSKPPSTEVPKLVSSPHINQKRKRDDTDPSNIKKIKKR